MYDVTTEVLASIALFGLIILLSSIKVVKEYERAVVFRLGRLLGTKGPGLFFRIPIVDTCRKVDLRVITFDVPKQQVVTKDNVTVEVDAVVYFRVLDAVKATVAVRDHRYATDLLSQTTLRDMLGQIELDELLTKREELGKRLTRAVDPQTHPWGVKVVSIAIKDVVLPGSMQRAIAKQAEAERERRARVIIADGEYKAAETMKKAADLYQRSPLAMRLRELQTLAEIARERNMVVVTTATAPGYGDVVALTQAAPKRG